jgi:hypothetical protein
MTNFFYFDQTNQKQGPVSEQQLRELVAQGIIGPHTPMEADGRHKGVAGQIPGLFVATPSSQALQAVAAPLPSVNLCCTHCGTSVSAQAIFCPACGEKPAGHKKFCRCCGAALNPEQIICIKCGTTVAGQAHPGTIAALNSFFMWHWICVAAAIPTCGLTFIPAVIFEYLLLYQLWKLIPADIARTTPGQAIGFMFIPFFNIYWQFIAIWGLGEDMNKTLQRRGMQYRVDENMGLISCILVIVAGIVGLVVLIFFLKSVKNAAIALLEQEGV